MARWALTLTLLLVALPARSVGAAPWQAQAAALQRDAAPRAVPGPGGSSGGSSYTAGPEYEDGMEQSSMETSKVLQEILREVKMILGGVKSLSLSSAVSRRSTGAGSAWAEPGAADTGAGPGAADTGAGPGAADTGAEPGAAMGRADTDPVNANSFQTYCIEGIVAVLGSMLLGMVLCCVLHVWRKRRKKT